MFDIHRSTLNGTEKCGSCAYCGKEDDIYKIEFTRDHANSVSINLCEDCLYCLGNEIFEMYMREVHH